MRTLTFGALVVLPLLVIVGATASACAGKTAALDRDASVPSDSGLGPRPADCPETNPPQDGACTKNGLLCEYGTDFNPLCNQVRVCSSGRWASPIHFGGAPKCPTQVPTVPPNPPDCPTTRAGIPDGQSCSTTTSSTCNYDGASCSCGVYCPSYPIRQRNCDADAGITTSCCDTTKVAWHCFEGPRYCGTPRPRIGSPCSKEGESCAVEGPAECGQTTIRCQKGVWDLTNGGCPISKASAKRDIRYVDGEERTRLHEELMSVQLATYRYKAGDDAAHLGFIIDDMPQGSPAVLPSRERVDLYGYVSMAVASLQLQEREIEALKADVARLAAENAAMKRTRAEKR